MNEKEIREIEERASRNIESMEARGMKVFPSYELAENCLKLISEIRRLQGIVEECEELKKA